MSIDSLVNFILSIENFPASIAILVLNFAITIMTYIAHKKNKKQKPFYSYLFHMLTGTLWVYFCIYFEPNGVITFVRYLELIGRILYIVLLLIMPVSLKKYLV